MDGKYMECMDGNKHIIFGNFVHHREKMAFDNSSTCFWSFFRERKVIFNRICCLQVLFGRVSFTFSAIPCSWTSDCFRQIGKAGDPIPFDCRLMSAAGILFPIVQSHIYNDTETGILVLKIDSENSITESRTMTGYSPASFLSFFFR